MERIENPMVRPIMEIVEACDKCNGLGVIEYTTCDYCERHKPFSSDCNRCAIEDIPIGINCPECGGNGFHVIER